MHERAHKVLEQVRSPLGLWQHQPKQKNALKLVVEGDPEELLYNGLCRLYEAIYHPIGEPLQVKYASEVRNYKR